MGATEEILREWESILERSDVGLPKTRQGIAKMLMNPVYERRRELVREWEIDGAVRVESTPILSGGNPDGDVLSKERLSELEPTIQRLRSELFYDEAPPLSPVAAGTNTELRLEIETVLADLEELRVPGTVKSAWTKFGKDFVIHNADKLLARLTGRSLARAPARFWAEIEQLSEATGFGTGQLLYHLLTGQPVELPGAVIEVQHATKGGEGQVARYLQATVKVYRAQTDKEVRDIFERLGGSRRNIGTRREAENAKFRRIVKSALTDVASPWSITTWEEHVVPAWKKGGEKAKAEGSLLKRYRRMTDRLLKELDQRTAAPDGRWAETRWKINIYEEWIARGMLDVGWLYLYKRVRRLEKLSAKEPPTIG